MNKEKAVKDFLVNPNDKAKMSKKIQNPKIKKYDLTERTAQFGEEIIDLAKELQSDFVNKVLISQIVRSGTSIGANYMEADASDSKRDFRYKIILCKKESKETLHWLRMLVRANNNKKSECKRLYQEARELCLIFSSIINKCRA